MKAVKSSRRPDVSAFARPAGLIGAASALLGAGAAHALDAGALPQGGAVVGGAASMAQSGRTLTVNQSSDRAVIDWRSFDIGSGAKAVFNQPGGGAIAVNRVNGSTDPTRIEGALSANGQVWILNPNGVLFGKTATVNVAGLLASTANIDPTRFMAGDTRLAFTGADRGQVVNEGAISVAANGLAAFVAPSVRNSGVITATVGKVALAAGQTFTLDLAGDRLVELGLGAGQAVVDQSGRIVDEGGVVTLSAKAAGQVVDSVINMSGVVSTASAHRSGGQIVLEGAEVKVAGALDASGTVGGTILLSGRDIEVGAGAALSADALTAGNGGVIRAVASSEGDYAGRYSARGGALGGDGGAVETSGKAVRIADDILVDTRAPAGRAGMWTIDPDNLTIGSSDSGGDADQSISAVTVEQQLVSTNVTLQARNSITVDTAIDTRGQTNGNTLYLKDENADGQLTINLNAPITLAATQHLAGDANLVNLANGALIQNGVDVALAGATVNLGTGDYAAGAKIDKAGLVLQGGSGARIDVAGGQTGLTIAAADVTVRGLEIAGPLDGAYDQVDWGTEPTSTGIAVSGNISSGVDNFSIVGNTIHDIRTGIIVQGQSPSGSITGNTVGNTKGGILVQYNDGTRYDIEGNRQGPVGNEWGIVLNLNAPGKNTGIAPLDWQGALLGLSDANDGLTVMDRRYALANRTAVSVDASSTAGAADDSNLGNGLGNARQPLSTIQAGINAVVTGGHVSVAAGTYDEALDIARDVDIVGAGVGQTIVRPLALLSTGVAHKYDPNVRTAVFVHDADAVNLSGLTIDGANLGANAIVFWNNASGSIADAQIENVGPFNGGQTGQGLAVDATLGRTVDLTLSNVQFANWNKNAIDAVTGQGATSGGGDINLTVRGSTFTGRGLTNVNTQNGILLWERGGGTVNATVDGSSFSNIAFADPSSPAAAILMYGSAHGLLTVRGSTFSDVQTYIALDGAPTAVDATQGNVFDGVEGSTATLDQLFAIEDRLVDKLDARANGLIRIRPGQVFVTAAKGDIQAGIDAASSGDTVNVQNGTYVIAPGGANYLKIDKSLTLVGQSEAGVVIDARNASTYGLRVTAPGGVPLTGVTLSDFTLLGVTAPGGYGLKAEGVEGLTIRNVTSQGAGKTEFDLNGVVGATLDHLTADGLGTDGNGIALTDSQNIVLSSSTTRNNAWGGLALYQSNTTSGFPLQETNITVDASNRFAEANPVYAEDQSATNDFGVLNIAGFDYLVKSPTNPADAYTWFQRTAQDAIDFAAGVSPTTAYVEGYGSGVTGNNVFTVGISSGGQALSIQTAVDAARTGGVVNIASGTYAQDVLVADRTNLNFGSVVLGGGLVVDTGAAGSDLSGQLSASSIALNAPVVLAGDLTLDTSVAGGTITTAAIDARAAGAQTLTVNAGAGVLKLGSLGATAQLGVVRIASSATLTGETYAADSLSFEGDVSLTAGVTTFNTTRPGGAGSITVAGSVRGASDGGQSLVLVAGSGTGDAAANGDISVQNVGQADLALGNLTVSGNDFGAQTVHIAGDFTSTLTGDQVFSSHTLDAGGSVNSQVGGDASGPINAGQSVNVAVGGALSGAITGTDVALSADTLTGATVNASQSASIVADTVTGSTVAAADAVTLNAGAVTGSSLTASKVTAQATTFDANVTASDAAISGQDISGNFAGGSFRLTGTGSVNANVNAVSLAIQAPQGSVSGSWQALDTSSGGGLLVNNQPAGANVNPSQLVVQGFALPPGSAITESGRLVLPVGQTISLLSPGDAGGAPKLIQVQTVQELGSLLSQGYTAIVIDLSPRKDGAENDKVAKLSLR